MDLHHLETFLAVYRLGSLTHAATAIDRSQPAVSAHLKALETELGKPLFVRLHRGVTPTIAGHALAADIEGPMESLDRILRQPPSKDLPRAPIVIGGPADALGSLVLPSLGPLIDRGLRLRMVFGLPRELLRLLGNGEVDIVIATTPSRHRGVAFTPLFEEQLLLVGPVELGIDHSDIESTKGSALSAVPLLAFAETAPLVQRYWREVFGGAAPRPAVIAEDLRAITALVASGHGWTVLPEYLVRDVILQRRLRVLHRPAATPTNTIHVAVRSETGRTTQLAGIVDHLRGAAANW